MKFLFRLLLFLTILNFNSIPQTKMLINKYNGTTDTLDFSEVKNIIFDYNLLQNGDFNSGLYNWRKVGDGPNPYHPEDPGRGTFTIKNGVLEIDINNEGISIWSIMLFQNADFEQGATYIISFEAKSDVSMEIISNVCQEGGTWENYSGDFKFNLTNIMTAYSYRFTMNKKAPALFQFCLGTIGTGKIYFDNIVMRKR
ncbi:MAG: carbohydrate binding domain-containing protein [Ignavibacteria bacterium]